MTKAVNGTTATDPGSSKGVPMCGRFMRDALSQIGV
jgi:hypothetical protein